MKEATEEQLIEACRRGVVSAQRELYDRYVDRLYHVILRYVKDTHYAENVLQDVFLKVFNNIQTYETQKGAFNTWVNTIAVREAINHCKKRKPVFEPIESTSPFNCSRQALILFILQAEEIMFIIGQIPLKYRIIFNLYDIDGYTHREIANLLEISESTSRSYLARAKGMIQQKVLDYYSPKTTSNGKAS